MKTISALLLFLSIISCGQPTVKKTSDTEKPKPTVDWKVLQLSNYSIQYPSTWELNVDGKRGTIFILFSPIESAVDKFRENVNLVTQDLTGKNIDLNKYAEISEGQIKTLLTNSNLIESKRIKNDSAEYHKIIFTGDQGVFHLNFEQYYWVINDKAYVLTFTSEQSKFADFKETGEKILNSFRFKK